MQHEINEINAANAAANTTPGRKAKLARPKKLRSGAWGLLVNTEDISWDEHVFVETRGGKQWISVITRVIWKGDGVAICEGWKLTREEEACYLATQTGMYFGPRY